MAGGVIRQIRFEAQKTGKEEGKLALVLDTEANSPRSPAGLANFSIPGGY